MPLWYREKCYLSLTCKKIWVWIHLFWIAPLRWEIECVNHIHGDPFENDRTTVPLAMDLVGRKCKQAHLGEYQHKKGLRYVFFFFFLVSHEACITKTIFSSIICTLFISISFNRFGILKDISIRDNFFVVMSLQIRFWQFVSLHTSVPS